MRKCEWMLVIQLRKNGLTDFDEVWFRKIQHNILLSIFYPGKLNGTYIR